jgi:hypothetical protein
MRKFAMTDQQKQSSNQNLSDLKQEQFLDSSSASREQKKSALEYPPATERSKRTNSANFGEGKLDDM